MSLDGTPLNEGDSIDYKKAYEEERERKNALNRGVVSLQNELLDARKQIAELMKINASGERQMFNQKGINHNIMTENNKKMQEFADEIERLRKIIVELGGNPN